MFDKEMFFIVCLNKSYYFLCNGILAHEHNSFHSSGYKPNWLQTKANSMVRFIVNFRGNLDSVRDQFNLQPELWKEVSWWTKLPLYTEFAKNISTPQEKDNLYKYLC